MKINVIFFSIAILILAFNFNLPLTENKKHYDTANTDILPKKLKTNVDNVFSPTINSAVNSPILSKTGSSNKESYLLPIIEKILVIGKNSNETEEITTDNEVTFNIEEALPKQRQGYLEYDLFGFEDFTCVSRSINDLISMGGKIIRLRNEWTHQVEKINISDLKQGSNIIRFNISENVKYRYKVKNVRIRFAEKITSDRKIVVNLPSKLAHYGEYAYLNGYIQSNDTVSYTLFADEKPVYVFDNHFDEIISLASQENPFVELKAVFNDGYVCSTMLNFNENKEYHYFSNNLWKAPFYKAIVSPQKVNQFEFQGISIITEENSVLLEKNLSIIGLRKEDMPLLDANMINVTANQKGFRCLPHGTLFEKAIDIRLNYDSTLIPLGYGYNDIRTFYYNDKTKKWEMLEYVGVDKDKKQILSKTNHFTDFINAILKTPELQQTLAYTPTSMKNMAYADPVAHINTMAPPSANNTGSANLSYPIEVPAGRQGLQPNLSVNYNNEKSAGLPGNGWDIPFPKISVDTRWGVPRYSETKETEEYLLNGEQLVELSTASNYTERLPLIHTDGLRDRNITISGETRYAYRVEGAFYRITRWGGGSSDYWWSVTDKNGISYTYGRYADDSGVNSNCVLRDTITGNIAEWALTEVTDLNGNSVKYEYGLSIGSVNYNTDKMRFLYPRKITYTNHVSAPGAYSVEFLAPSSYVPGSGQFSERYGFPQVEKAPIEQIIVKYNNSFVRGYYFKYKTGAYDKSLLCSVVEYTDSSTISLINSKNCTQLATDYIHGAKAHVFQYFEEAGLDFQSSAVSVLSSTEEQDNILNFFIDPTIQSIGRTKNFSEGGGGSICFGFDPNAFSKSKTVGANFSFTHGSLIEKVQLLDINGDGLLDKIVKQGGVYNVHYGQLNGSNELIFTSTSTEVQGLPHLSRTYNTAWSTGLEAQWPHGFISATRSWDKQVSDRYFADINADGFPDFVNKNEVLLNNGILFAPISNSIISTTGDTCYSINYSGSIDSSFYTDDSEGVASFSFRRDPVKVWISPISDCRLMITNNIKRTVPSSKNNLIYYSVQHNDQVVYSNQIGANDTTAHSNTLFINPEKGDYVYFRIHSSEPIGKDDVIWDPIISVDDYELPNNIIDTNVDANEKHIYIYQYSQDAVVSDNQFFNAPFKGHVYVNGNISSPAQSDTLSFLIKHNQTLLVDTIYLDNQSFSRQFNFDLAVDAGDSVIFRLLSKSNVNWSDIDFSSKIQYYQADSFPTLTVADSVSYYTPLQMSIFPQIGLFSKLISVPAGTYSVYPHLAFTDSISGSLTYTIKTKRNILTRKTINVTNGVVQNPQQYAVSFTIAPADTVYADYFSYDPNMGRFIDTAYVINSANPSMKAKSGFYSTFPDTLKKFGNLSSHWGQFSYFDTLDSIHIDPSKLSYTNYLPDSNAINDIDLSTIDTTSSFNDVSNIFSSIGADELNNMSFVLMLANNKENKWDDYLKSARISPQIMTTQDGYIASLSNSSNSYTFEEEVPDPDLNEPDVVNHTPFPNLTVKKTSRVTSNTFAFSSGGNTSTTVSTTNSKGLKDFMDMNGDRYPDIISDEKIQYTNQQGGMAGNAFDLDDNSYTSGGYGLSCGLSYGIKPMSMASIKCNDGLKAKLKNIDGSAGLGASVGGFVTNYIYIDMNGDGLPDKFDKENNTVTINTGYGFMQPISWNIPGMPMSASNSFSITSGLQSSDLCSNIKHYSWSLGFGGTQNSSKEYISFYDVNNDGLNDICYGLGTSLVAFINLGTTFSSSPTILNSTFTSFLSSTSSTNIGTDVAVTFGISMAPSPFKITFSPYLDVSYSISSVKDRLMDLNGDNTLDMVSVENIEVKVRYGIPKKVNMLKKVITPLKSSYTIDYLVSYPSDDNPSSKWVMSSLKVFDGFTGDGADTTYYKFGYINPYYHRMERDFFGFESVFTNLTNNNGVAYRKYEDQYHIDNYLFKGLKKYDVVKNASNQKYVETLYTYDYKSIPTGDIVDPSQVHCPCTVYPAISQENKYYYEGQSTSSIHTKKAYSHGPFGNIKEYINYGNASYPDDDVKANIYYKNYLAYNLTGLVDSVTVLDFQNNLLQKRTGTYNWMGRLTKIKSSLNSSTDATTDISYDTLGNVTYILYPANSDPDRLTYIYAYDSIAHTYPTRVTDYWGNYSSTLYDLRLGLPLEQTDIAGNKTQFGYYNDGKLKYVIGPYEMNTGHHTIDCEYWDERTGNTKYWARTLHYDPIDTTNKMLTINFADGMKRQTQSKKNATVNNVDLMVVSGKIIYDNYGRVANAYLPITETLNHDSIFNTNVSQYYSTSTYDVLDRPIQQTLPDNTTYNFTYGFGQDYFSNTCFIKETTDPNSNVTQECINALGQNTTVFAPLSTTTAFVYDPLGQLVQSIDPETNNTYYQYDMLGRMIQRTHPDAGITNYTFDLAGKLLTKQTQNLIDNNNVEIDYIYNDNRLVNITYPENPEMNVYYKYGQPNSANQTGRLIEMQDATGAQTYTYGKLGELIQNVRTCVIPITREALTFSTSWDYDTWGRTKSIEYPDGEVVHYGYNHGGNLITMNSVKGNYNTSYIDNIKYNEFGQRTRIDYGNSVRTDFSYNPANQRLVTLVSTRNVTLQYISYEYDDIGNIVYINNQGGYDGSLGGPYSIEYGYDQLNRLSTATGSFDDFNQNTYSYNLSCSYSSSGNITSKELIGSSLINGTTNSINYNNSYKYNDRPHNATVIGSDNYNWDANGNMIGKQNENFSRTLCWDEENRLTSVRDQVEDPQLSLYMYDANGERTWKFIGTTNLMMVNGNTLIQQTTFDKTLYVNPYLVVTEEDYTKHYFIEGERVATKIGGGFADAPIFPWDSTITFIIGNADSLSKHLEAYIVRQAECSGDISDAFIILEGFKPISNNNDEEPLYFYNPDHLGSASFITDETGTAIQHLQYFPFGELFVSQMAGSFDSRYKFSAKELDNETNYSYFGARYYTSEESIWLSVDPMSDKYPSLSPYNYCLLNPMNFIDPNGEETIIPPTIDEYNEYNISQEARDRFEAILHNIESFKTNEPFMKAFMSTTGLSREKAEEYLTYGSGPKVDIVSGFLANAESKDNFTFGADIINHLGSIDSKNANYLGGQAFGAAMVLVDELSHCGDMEFNKTNTSTGQNANNPGKQRWSLSPLNHRGGDSQVFGFGVMISTARDSYTKNGIHVKSGTVIITPATLKDIRNKQPNLPVIPTFNKQSIYSIGINLLK